MGEIDDSDRYLMTTGTNGCGDAAVPQNANFLNRRNSCVLHIHAEADLFFVTIVMWRVVLLSVEY